MHKLRQGCQLRRPLGVIDMLSQTLFLLLLAIPAIAAEPPELHARHWLNGAEPKLIPDGSTYLFFFKADDQSSARFGAKLARLAYRKDVQIIGLSPSSRTDTERMIRALKLRFPIGAESDSAKEYHVKQFPCLLKLAWPRESPAISIEVSIDQLDAQLPPIPSSDPKAISELADVTQLQLLIEFAGSGKARSSAVARLFELQGSNSADVFRAFMEARLDQEQNPFVRGDLRFFRSKSLGQALDDDKPSESSTYLRNFKANPEDPSWATYREFVARSAAYSSKELAQGYRDHASGSPTDVLCRDLVVRTLSASQDRAGARQALMQIVAEEPDRSIRMHAASALGRVCDIGDVEAAALLEQLAENEKYVWVVRPTMEFVANYLRTGKETPD